ncbi:MAG TPA: hypothetical protein PK177_09690 [Burkholderiaceae bacterium]|nr:hypothetical protein [Burkholderiaceae bacterium]
MTDIISTSIALIFVGLFTLIVGYTKRDKRNGPLLVWAGVLCMLSVIVYYILRRLQ